MAPQKKSEVVLRVKLTVLYLKIRFANVHVPVALDLVYSESLCHSASVRPAVA